MATSDISKEAVFDARIVQLPARYAVEKGSMSLTNAPFRAITATTSQHTYQINVPSQNVFVDRAIDWSSDVYMALNVATADLPAATTATEPILEFGRDIALCAFPLHELTQTMTSSINDTSVVINTDTVLHEVLRLTDYKKNRLVRHCPTMMDRYKSYTDSNGAVNSPLQGYFDATASDEVPNGAWGQVVFTNAIGAVLVGGGSYTATNAAGVSVTVTYVNGIPVRTYPAAEPADYPLYIRWTSSEKLVLSPFIFADSCEWETGLFGINNMQLVCNLKSDPSRVLRLNSTYGRRYPVSGGKPRYNTQVANGAFQEAQVNVQFLTPSLDLPLPAKSSVPYTEFPRYITNGTSNMVAAAGAAPGIPSPTPAQVTVQSQTIVLPNIPDYLLIYVKPSTPQDGTTLAGVDADWYFPIENISMNFDNFAGLLSNQTQEQLYQMSAHNGLEMDWNEWTGLARIPGAKGLIQTVGGFLVIKPGVDFGLQAGQAPSLIGNFTLQFRVTVNNYSDYAGAYALYVVAVNSGFFESLAGSSRIIKGVLSEADIISAEPIMEMSRDGLKRMVGNGFFSNLGSMLSKAVEIYSRVKPVASAVKGVLPEGKVKDVMGKLGFGMSGAAMPAGAAMRKGKKSLSERLM